MTTDKVNPSVRKRMKDLERRAKRGVLRAQHDLAARLAKGDPPFEKNEAEAVRWYRRAARRGYAESQYDLAWMLLLGEGSRKSTQQALRWFGCAARSGFEDAARVLADLYRLGSYGVRKAPARARRWSRSPNSWRRKPI